MQVFRTMFAWVSSLLRQGCGISLKQFFVFLSITFITYPSSSPFFLLLLYLHSRNSDPGGHKVGFSRIVLREKGSAKCSPCILLAFLVDSRRVMQVLLS